jgi:hypothetical protein
VRCPYGWGHKGACRYEHGQHRQRPSELSAHTALQCIGIGTSLRFLIWHLLSKVEDYRYAAPMLTRPKLRELKSRARNLESHEARGLHRHHAA